MAFLGIVGTDVHRLPLQELERVAAVGRDSLGFARRARECLHGAECVPLVTCNRVELVVASEKSLDPARLGAAFHHALGRPDSGAPLFVHLDEGAARHLLRVACSLESAALGEEQILGQVRDSIGRARGAELAGNKLAALFDLALRVGKRVRRETGLADLGTDLARLALRHLKPELRSGDAAPIALIGTGEMARAVLAARPKDAREGWLVVSRDLDRARATAREFDCAATSLDAFLAERTPLRALVAATISAKPTIGAEFLRARLPLGGGVVDLGLPRNVDPAARTHVRLADLADLRALADDHREKL